MSQAPAAHPPRRAVGDLLWHNPLWRPVWGLWGDRRAIHSALVGLIVALGLLAAVEWAGRIWVQSVWDQPGAVTPMQRVIYAGGSLWRHIGLETVLLVFGVTMLWTSARRGMAPMLPLSPLRPLQLLVVIFLPLAFLWGAVEIWGWVQDVVVARHLAGPGDNLLWLIRRPGRVTFLTDPGPPISVVLSHNVVTGAVAAMGYVIFLEWWLWVSMALVARQPSLSHALVGLLSVGGAVLVGVAGVEFLQGRVSLLSPMAPWMFPPGTSATAAWRGVVVTPGQHLTLYAVMHLSILLLEFGLVGVLRVAVNRATGRLWLRMTEALPDTADGAI